MANKVGTYHFGRHRSQWGIWMVESISNGVTMSCFIKDVYSFEDAFDVYFLNNKKELVKKVEEVYLDNLVDVIDFNVEKDGSFDYDKRVREQYSIRIY